MANEATRAAAKVSKAEAVRAIVSGNSNLSNQIIKDLVWKQFGLRVETNQLIGLVGSQRQRMALDGLLPLAQKLVDQVGHRLAVNLIHRVKRAKND